MDKTEGGEIDHFPDPKKMVRKGAKMKRKIIEKKINSISEHYSRECQTAKTKEELRELLIELDAAIKINGQIVLPDNTWSEIADVIIMCSQLAMQHGKTGKVRQEIEYKVNRQIWRMENEIARR